MDLLTALVNKISPLTEINLANLTAKPVLEVKSHENFLTIEKAAGNTGVIVAFFLNFATAQTIRDACIAAGLPEDMVTPLDQFHITLANLGNATDLALQKWSSPREVAERLEYSFSRYELPLVGRTTGIGLFDPVVYVNETGETIRKRPLVLLFDSPQLPEFREHLTECLDSCGLSHSMAHGFIPHITLAYLSEKETIPEALFTLPQQSLLFTEMVLAWGEARFELPLSGIKKPELVDYEDCTVTSGVSYPAYKSSMVVKEINGQWWFFAFSSSGFEDQDGEWTKQRSLLVDCARADLDGNYGPFFWWHEPSFVLGTTEINDMEGSILVEAGTFKTPLIAKAMQALAPDLGISIGFRGWRDPEDPKSFIKIRRTERSALPREIASNRLTAMAVIQKSVTQEEVIKSMTEKLNVMFNGLLAKGWDAETARSVLADVAADANTLEKAAAESGLVQKEVTASSDQPQPLTAEVLKQVLTSFSTKLLETVNQVIDQKLAGVATEQATKETAVTTQLAVVAEAVKATNTALAELKAGITQIAGKVSELEGEQPSIVKQLTSSRFVKASEDPGNVVTDPKTLAELKAGSLTEEQQKMLANPIYAMVQQLVAGSSPLLR